MKKFLSMMVMAALACGPGKGGETESETSASSGSSSEGGSTTSAGTASTTTASSTAPTTGTDACEMFAPESEEFGPTVKLMIVNSGSEPVWMNTTGCGGTPAVSLLDGEGNDRFYSGGDCFPERCEDFIGATDCWLGCNDCGAPFGRVVLPGGSTEINWNGALSTTATMTAECSPGENCQRECFILRKAEPGMYTFGLTVFRACTGACACDIDPSPSSCGLWEQVEFTEPVELSLPFTYPDEATVMFDIGA